jgi:hypothetical protein
MENTYPNCVRGLKITVDGFAQNFKCDYCGYSYATTIAEGIEWDSKDYIIVVENNNAASINQIKAISSVSSLNFIAGKKLLLDGGALTKGKATTIKKIVAKLESENIKFKITPEFIFEAFYNVQIKSLIFTVLYLCN